MDRETRQEWKVPTRNSFLRQVFIGIPVTLIFMCAIVGSQALSVWIKYRFSQRDADSETSSADGEESDSTPVPWYLSFAPATMNAVLIVVFGAIYKKVIVKLVDGENHRYTDGYENSMIVKVYMFQFVNTYISNFVIILINQRMFSLQTNLITIIVVKQLLANVFEFFYDKYMINRKFKKVDALFKEKMV